MANFSVLIVDGESLSATSVVSCLAAANVRVHVLSRTEWAPVRVSRHIASFHAYPEAAGTPTPADVIALARHTGADICMAVEEEAIRRFSGEWADVCGAVPIAAVPSRESFDITDDKWKLASFLESRQLPHPRTAACNQDAALATLIDTATYPVLLKPRHGGNGAGIVRQESGQDVLDYIERHPSMLGRYVIQTVFPGSDIDCSVLCEQGRILAHTIQQPIGPASAHFKPAGAIEFVRNDAVFEIVTRLMAALGWSGVAHVDLRRDDDGNITIVEVNPRYWGSLLGSLRAGVNFPFLSVLAGLGQPLPEVAFQPCQYVGGRAAVHAWLRSLIGSQQTFEFDQTAWAHILHDPAPRLLDMWT